MKALKNLIGGLIVLLTFSTITTTAMAQNNNFTLTELQDKSWGMIGMKDKSNTENFSNNRISSYLNGQLMCISEYYLSDSIETAFDSNKVGKALKGKYIIRRIIREKGDTRPTPISVFEIKSLNKNSLIIKNVEHKHMLTYKINY